MSIHFTDERWKKIKTDYSLFWDNKLDRPLIPIWLEKHEPTRKEPKAPLLSQATCHLLDIPAKDIIDRIDYELSKYEFIGDAYPYFNLDCFGPGVVAAFLGANLDNSSGKVWFFPKEELPITDIHFEYDPNNIWLNRIKEICQAGMEFWQGQVLMGMTDLGGVVDILSSFRSPEKLLLDLYDYPEEVKRCVQEIQELWFKFYDEINAVLQPVNPGYSDWAKIYSDKPTYIYQCDFAYMISTKMFNEFSMLHLESDFKRVPNSAYHLDGVGQLKHLDSLLSVPELGLVQWVPGAGKPGPSSWLDVYQKIHDAGKKIQIHTGDFDDLDNVINKLGTAKGIHLRQGVTGDEYTIRKKLAEYGIE